MSLTSSDYELLLGAVHLLNSDSRLETLPARTMNSVFSLIPNEMLVFDGFGTDANYSGYLWYSPPGTVSAEQVQTLSELIYEHPVYQDIVVNRAQKTVRTSDYLSLAEFHRLAIYNEFYRHIGGDAQMTASLVVSPELYITCSLHRAKTDFTDREWKLLELFAPHLVAAFRNAQFIQRLTSENQNLQAALDAALHGVVTLDPDLKVLSRNFTAARFLHKYFSLSEDFPEELRRVVAHHRQTVLSGEFYLPLSLLEIKQKNSRLKIRLTFESEARTFILLLEEETEPQAADLHALGLTSREAEVLFFLAAGKTNREIGALCGISPRTVQKHLENIFPKLGVETRAAAAATATEFMSKKH